MFVHKELQPIAADYTDVVIDGPPRIHAVAKSVVLAADIVVIPVQPSPTDVWATSETVDLITDGRVYNEKLRPLMVITRSIANTAIARDVRGALSALDVPLLGAALGQRVVFAEALDISLRPPAAPDRSADTWRHGADLYGASVRSAAAGPLPQAEAAHSRHGPRPCIAGSRSSVSIAVRKCRPRSSK